jgi:hypothetical protein
MMDGSREIVANGWWKKRVRRWSICILLSSFLGGVGGCFGRVWYGQQFFCLGQKLAAIEAENLQLTRRCTALQAKVASIHTPTHLQMCADLRMAPPENGHLVRVSMGNLHGFRRKMALTAKVDSPRSTDEGEL